MDWYSKNWRRCNINTKTIVNKIKIIIIVTIFVFLFSLFSLFYFDKRLSIILKPYIDEEAERLTTNIIEDSVNKFLIDKSYKNFLIYNYDEELKKEKISYDTEKINKMRFELTEKISKTLIDIDNGVIEPKYIPERIKKGRFKHIRKGILCDISFSSLRNSTLFANIGPSIPIKLVFLGQVSTDIQTDIKDYGINNMMVSLNLVIVVKEQISMPISSIKKNVSVKIPISMDIVKGEVPSYYGYGIRWLFFYFLIQLI